MAKPGGRNFGSEACCIARTTKLFLLDARAWIDVKTNVRTNNGVFSSMPWLPPSAGNTITFVWPWFNTTSQHIRCNAAGLVMTSPSGASNVHGASQSAMGAEERREWKAGYYVLRLYLQLDDNKKQYHSVDQKLTVISSRQHISCWLWYFR